MGISLWEYLARTARDLSRAPVAGTDTLAHWTTHRPVARERFLRALGLFPFPDKCPLDPVVTRRFAGPGYAAEAVSFHLLPGVHASANIYRPSPLPPGRQPGMLYVCGHMLNGVLEFQEHALLWVRKGYVCVILDTIEQHDNRGDHHAVFLGKRADWMARGYSAAGGELWNSLRGFDLLLSLPEVDPLRCGVTGLSGGGAQSFLCAAADERVAAVASACGVAVMEQLVADRAWERFCDCMVPWNMFREDTPWWAALIAPRPLLLCFAADDDLFAPAGTRHLADRARAVYGLYGKAGSCALRSYPGGHGYTPEMVADIGAWMDEHVAGGPRPSLPLQPREHDEAQVSVFNGELPADDRLDLLPELLSRRGSIPLPRDPAEGEGIRARARESLLAGPLSWIAESREELVLERLGHYARVHNEAPDRSRSFIPVRGRIADVDVWMQMSLPARASSTTLVGLAAPGETATEVMARLLPLCGDHGLVCVEPRAAGMSSLDHSSPFLRTHLARAAAYLGLTETLLGVHDGLRFLDALRRAPELAGQRLCLYGRGDAGIACLYIALMDEAAAGVIAHGIPISHLEGGAIVGILPVLDIPHAIGLVAPRPCAIPGFGVLRGLWAETAYLRMGVGDRFFWGDPLPRAVERVLAIAGEMT
jgi:dienelactone hydrolase